MKKITLWLASTAVLVATQAHADLTIVTLGGVGSQSDTSLRYLQPALQAKLGENINIVNVPGGNGVLGMRAAAGRDAESTLLAGSVYLSVADLSTDVEARALAAKFVPVSGLTSSRQLIIVPRDSKLKSLADLSGKQLNGGSAYISSEFIIAQLDSRLKARTTVVRYRQASQMVVDALDGRLDYIVGGSGNSSTEGFIASGQLRPIAVVGDTKLQSSPSLPTTYAAGLKGLRDFGWSGLFSSTDMSTARQTSIRAAFKHVLASQYGQAYGQRPGSPVIYSLEPEALADVLAADTKALRTLVPNLSPGLK